MDQRAKDIESAYDPDLPLEKILEIIRREIEPALLILARSLKLDPLVFDTLLAVGKTMPLVALASRTDLTISQQFRLANTKHQDVIRRLCKSPVLPAVVMREILMTHPKSIVSLIEREEFKISWLDEIIELLDEKILAITLASKKIPGKLLAQYRDSRNPRIMQIVLKRFALSNNELERLVDLRDEALTLDLLADGRAGEKLVSKILGVDISLKVHEYVIEHYTLTLEQLKGLYFKDKALRQTILSNKSIDQDIKSFLIESYTPQEPLEESNERYATKIKLEHPALSKIFEEGQVNIKDLFKELHSMKYSPEMADILLCIILLEYSTNSEVVGREAYTIYSKALSEYEFNELLESRETSIAVTEEMRYWIHNTIALRGQFGLVNNGPDVGGDLRGYLSSAFSLEKIYAVGFRFNRYLEYVCESYFCPFYLLELAISRGNEHVQSLAQSTKQRKLFESSSRVIEPHQVIYQRLKDYWNDVAEDMRSMNEDHHIYEAHKRETGY